MRLALLLLTASVLSAQQPDLVSQANRLQLLLQQIRPQNWPDSATYTNLLQSIARDNLAIASAHPDQIHPDEINDSLKLLEQMHAVQESLSRLVLAVSKYQNPALAELIVGIQTEGKPARDAYRDHVLQLVADREEQFQVADHEAQRCRAILSKDPKAVKSR